MSKKILGKKKLGLNKFGSKNFLSPKQKIESKKTVGVFFLFFSFFRRPRMKEVGGKEVA